MNEVLLNSIQVICVFQNMDISIICNKKLFIWNKKFKLQRIKEVIV